MPNAIVVVLAQDLLYALVAVAGLVWLLQSRPGKVRMAAEGVVGLAVVGVLILVLAHLHTDPRPFVSDGSTPLFPHPADNGFPSDHSAAAGLLAGLVAHRRRILGALVGVGALLIAWSRVAAHVHHLQDVAAGLTIGVVAAVAGVWLVGLLVEALARRGLTVRPRALATSDRTARS